MTILREYTRYIIKNDIDNLERVFTAKESAFALFKELITGQVNLGYELVDGYTVDIDTLDDKHFLTKTIRLYKDTNFQIVEVKHAHLVKLRGIE